MIVSEDNITGKFLKGNFRSTYGLTKEDTVKIMEANITEYNIDSLYEVAPLMQKQKVISSAASRAENLSSDITQELHDG